MQIWPEHRPWSWSALESFELCPENYYRTRVLKDVDDAARPGLAPGQEMHKAIETYVKTGKALPLGLRKFETIINKVAPQALDIITEGRGGLTSDLHPTDFFGADVSCRMVLDFLAEYEDSSILLDWKSSSQPRESIDQLRLYCLFSLQKYPHHKKAHAGFVYSNFPNRLLTVHRHEAMVIAEDFRPRVEKFDLAYKEGHWPRRPSWKCKAYCPVLDCPHNQKGR